MALDFQNFPDQITIVLGPVWGTGGTGFYGLHADSVITLDKLYSSPSTMGYSEDGTADANTTTNRISVFMRSFGSEPLQQHLSMSGVYSYTVPAWTLMPNAAYNAIYYGNQSGFNYGDFSGLSNIWPTTSFQPPYEFRDVFDHPWNGVGSDKFVGGLITALAAGAGAPAAGPWGSIDGPGRRLVV